MRKAGGWWRRKSTPAKFETYVRWSFHSLAAVEVLLVGPSVVAGVGVELGGWVFLTVCVHAALCCLTISRALSWVRGRREQPIGLLWTLGAVSAAVATAALAVTQYGPGGERVDSAAGGIFSVVLIYGVGVLVIGVRSRRRVIATVGSFALGAALMALALGVPAPVAVVGALGVLVGGGVVAASSVFSVWLVNAVYELDDARDTRARLAVAEERLRFGRDLHDVMGRNLAVIALKSELAVQLARRGRPEAVEQMIEVQRIAQESQREVRDVVRGYREADLGVELAGAQGVLRAAGIDCEVTAEDAAGLAAEVQSALAWVVREATTNVLRHGDAGRCGVAVRVLEGRVVLTVENDGAAGAPHGGGGSGLAGLRERLAAVDGTLEAGCVGEGVFRLVAEVPVVGAGMRGVTV
ncbi:sensor histidine kinase [Streptomyces sp. ISL-22]|uniref:sensor histidine kinase n=1 Tax=unclassified Streptomyces TaxID=2593676 RepID=UPI001BE8104B|nr:MULTISPECIES: sensor histidine kinase [unclassified Streptomyces]MBT2422277.1 sensor histidine kinase [Streptomyces sp. ISL-24]MBT2435840.1 sensor histidine kinase [Streptomyces sp. ISL-22]